MDEDMFIKKHWDRDFVRYVINVLGVEKMREIDVKYDMSFKNYRGSYSQEWRRTLAEIMGHEAHTGWLAYLRMRK